MFHSWYATLKGSPHRTGWMVSKIYLKQMNQLMISWYEWLMIQIYEVFTISRSHELSPFLHSSTHSCAATVAISALSCADVHTLKSLWYLNVEPTQRRD